MRYHGSKQYREASSTTAKEFVGLKSKPYNGRAFVVDESDAKMIVANLNKGEYQKFKRLYRTHAYAPFRALQDIEFERKRKHAPIAKEMFVKAYGGSKNFMTPNAVKFGKISKRSAYEISSGKGIYDDTIYGVTVVSQRGSKVIPSNSRSKVFHSRSEAESYVARLKRK